MIIDEQPYLQMVVAKQRAAYPFAYAQQPVSPYHIIDKPCAEVSVELKEVRCADPETYHLSDCNRAASLQAEAFASSANAPQ